MIKQLFGILERFKEMEKENAEMRNQIDLLNERLRPENLEKMTADHVRKIIDEYDLFLTKDDVESMIDDHCTDYVTGDDIEEAIRWLEIPDEEDLVDDVIKAIKERL